MYNIINSHQLIPRQQTYNLNKKILTVHAEDRDIRKWPFSNTFAIECPAVYTNVETIRLIDISLPSVTEVFNNDYQNTKLSFKLNAQNVAKDWYLVLLNNSSCVYTITIQDGAYSGAQLANEIQNKLNQAINDYLKTTGLVFATSYLNFKVYYDSVSNTLHFGNIEDSFTFLFDTKVDYVLNQCEQPDVFERASQWGLPWNLGFEKQEYTPVPLLESAGSNGIIFYYNSYGSSNYLWLPAGTSLPSYYLKAPLSVKNQGENAIYMEIERFNYVDELKPYSTRTTDSYQNDYGGRINSAFIKIPITANVPSYSFDSINLYLNNCGYYTPPIDKVSKLKFRFRYHDGRLVNFKDTPFNFSLEINQIRNEIEKNYSMRTPTIYNS
jgi:hypothetical protein